MNTKEAKTENNIEIDEILKKINGEPYDREKAKKQFEDIEAGA